VGSVCRRLAGRGLVYFLLVRVVPMSIILMLASTLAILGVLLFLLAWRARSKTGIPAGEVFYQDLIGQPFQGEVLRSARWGISGKPDCLIRTPEGVVPVELKKSKKPPARGEIYPNHRIQNLAYCALVEDQMRVRVPYGLVIYAGQRVRRVEYTEASRRWLAEVIQEVRGARTLTAVMRNHRISGRCSGCGLRPHCDQSLI
jgi:CRISPR-associated protein Cas4